MATDKTEPRTMLILAVGLISIGTLLVSRFVLQSYFISITEAEERIKIAEQPPAQVRAMRAAEAERLGSGSMPIAEAMRAIASGQRPAAIAPQPSTDLAPLQGWSQRPVNLAPAGVAPAPAPPTPAPASTAEGTVGGSTAVHPEGGDAGVAPSEHGGTQPPAAQPNNTGAGAAAPHETGGAAGAANAAAAPHPAPHPPTAPPTQGPNAAPTNTHPAPAPHNTPAPTLEQH